MSHKFTRARMGALLAVAAMTSSAGLFAGSAAQAAAPTSHSGSVSAAAVPVSRSTLSNQFGTLRSRVSGTFGKHGTVTGHFTPRKFKVPSTGPYAGQLVAVGKLKATLTRGNGHVVGTDTKKIHIPVAKANGGPLPTARATTGGSCQILNLTLGPLDLDLLGLQVHLDTVHLNITAQPGTGNLLGNLLCAVAGLLDQNGTLTQISQILTSILAILNL